jgi:type VI protein secretion system component VasK
VYYYFSGFWQWVAMTIGVIIAAVFAYILARWSWRWLVVLCVTLAAVVFLVWLPIRHPAHAFLDESTPSPFLNYFWPWIFLLTVGFTLSLISFGRTLYQGRPAAVQEGAVEGEADRASDLDSAWREIQLRLSNARIDVGAQHVYLVLSPDEGWTSALVHSANLQLFAEGPDGEAPVHAYATADGIFLSVAGASAFGVQSEEGGRSLENVCRRLLAERPDCPVVRGVVVLLPITWAGQPESVKWASSIRDDLRTIERILKVRCPVFAVFSEMETTDGFPEFVGRMSAALRQSRCGFAVPASHPFSGELVQNGLIWMSGWYHGWILSLMADDLFNVAGNNQLFSLDIEFRRYRKRLRSVLEAAFSTHRETEPMLFRGCYFTATGANTREQAFTPGLLRGPRGRILVEHPVTQWTQQAQDDDRFYRRLALVVGLVGGGLSLLTWFAIIAMTSSLIWWAGPVVMALVWLIVIYRVAR